MNELLKSLKTADKDGITEDLFISVEKHVERYPMYDETTHLRLRKPKVGEKSEEVMVVAKCGQRPPKVSDPKKVDEHTCVRNFNFDALVNYEWIVKIFGDKIRANLDIRLCDIADLVMKKYKCKVSLNQCTNAKKYALIEYEKSIGEHYSMLRSYGIAILDFNPRSTVKLGVTLNPDGKTYYDSPNQGEILTTIGRDKNNHIYPVAWAVVNVENEDNWTWFLELLESDLGYSRGNGLTLMSDQHKGLIEAVKDVMPNAEHRQCARHICENFKKQYHGLEYRQLFWATSKASYPQLFNKIMDKIKSANPNAHKFWHVIPVGGNLYEVKSGSEGFTVDEDMYFVAYHNYVKPVFSMNFWPDQSVYFTFLPPKPRKIPGRPRKKRIRAIGEGGSSTRVSKVGSQGSCSNCKKPGHNKSSCKELVVEQTPKPKGVVGRPRKKQPVDDFEDVDVVQRGPMRDEGASGTRGGAIWSRGRVGRGGAVGSRGGASGSIGRGAGGFGGASGLIGRGAGGSGGASGQEVE
ncbi:multidrug resistance-associated protein 5, partial [Tanacetum coccineum]